MTTAACVKRAFADLSHGQIHYRTAGDGTPLLLIHASPGGSRQLTAMIEDLGSDYRVIAPDTPGNGDSVALQIEELQITDIAEAYLELLDTLHIDRISVYGSHTGAAIATELAILAPERIDRLILDGVQNLTDEARKEALERYALPFPADLDGAYLMRAFQFCRDQYMFYPWYARTRANRRVSGLPAPQVFGEWVVEVLKAGETYHLSYRAAFRWRAGDRLPLIGCPTLLLAAANDPLVEDTRALSPLVPSGTFVELPTFDAPNFIARRQAGIRDFLSTQ